MPTTVVRGGVHRLGGGCGQVAQSSGTTLLGCVQYQFRHPAEFYQLVVFQREVVVLAPCQSRIAPIEADSGLEAIIQWLIRVNPTGSRHFLSVLIRSSLTCRKLVLASTSTKQCPTSLTFKTLHMCYVQTTCRLRNDRKHAHPHGPFQGLDGPPTTARYPRSRPVGEPSIHVVLAARI